MPLFSSSEIGRARARGVTRRSVTARDDPPRLPTEPACPRHTDRGNDTPLTDPAGFIGERLEREGTRAGITTEGAEAVHHSIGESLRCATHAQAEYHQRPCEATATAMDEARTMVSDGINVLSGTVPPAMRARYTRNDDGIYGCPSGSERAFTREMLNLRPLDPLEEQAPPMAATPEFLAQQRNRRSIELAEGPPDHRTAVDPAGTPSQIPMTPPTSHSGTYTVRMTQTQVWQAEAFAETAG